jgi:sialidase-1
MGYRATITASIIPGILALGSPAAAQLWLHPACVELPLDRSLASGPAGSSVLGPLVILGDGRLLTVEGTVTRTSSDDGKTWSPPQPIYTGPGPGIPSADYCVLLRTQAGTLVLVYVDMSTFKWAWDRDRHEAAPDVRADVWAIRSLDEGQTWTDRQELSHGYCGALITMIQTSRGQIVAPMMRLLDRTRHATFTCVSTDDGKTWQRGNIIDLGGHGDHDGGIEPTVAELSDGRLLMLLRTNLDRFWEAYSDDGGRYWRQVRPSTIDASTSPGYLARLASGRLALVWNRLYPEGQNSYPRSTAGDLDRSEGAASWHRQELALAFSEDDGKTWTKPVVVARQPQVGQSLGYPYILERRPGELWIVIRYEAKLAFSLKEVDFVRK